jgi:hypothetical protein
MNTESLAVGERTVILARIAHGLTVCARETYEAGTENVLEPQVLRSYNELLHRVTAAVQEHVLGTPSFSLETILEIVREFGTQHGRVHQLNSVLNRAMQEFRRNPS